MVENNERMVDHVKGERIYSDYKKATGNSLIPAYKKNMGVMKGKDHTKYK